MKNLKEKVLKFMESTDTSDLNTNEFIWEFIMYISPWSDELLPKRFFTHLPSMETILRARRFIIKTHGIGVRTKADTEEEYIWEYALNNKI